jgi:hypothetical protein
MILASGWLNPNRNARNDSAIELRKEIYPLAGPVDPEAIFHKCRVGALTNSAIDLSASR